MEGSIRQIVANRAPQRHKKAGHRSWAARSGKITGGNRGDIMSVAKRSALMARIRGKHTNPERTIAALLLSAGFKFEQHTNDLPGRPDIAFRTLRVAIFIDGDFWHGWRFPLWKAKLTMPWQSKIETTRKRDQRNFRKLRQQGWRVLRIWEHQVERDSSRCVNRITSALKVAAVADVAE